MCICILVFARYHIFFTYLFFHIVDVRHFRLNMVFIHSTQQMKLECIRNLLRTISAVDIKKLEMRDLYVSVFTVISQLTKQHRHDNGNTICFYECSFRNSSISGIHFS